MLRPERYLVAVGILDRTPGVVVPREPVPVVLTAHWQDGSSSEHPGRAVAWTPEEVEVVFMRGDGAHQGAMYRGVWLPVADVRRAG